MKPTIRTSRKAHSLSVRLGLLAAVSGLALGAVSSRLVAQTIESPGGYSTGGLPTAAQIHGVKTAPRGAALPTAGPGAIRTPTGSAPAGAIQPIGVGANVSAPISSPIGGLGGAVIGAPGQEVRRGRWTTSWRPFVELTATYSDNINLSPDGFEEDDTVLTATAGVVLGAQSERLAGTLAYAASYDTYLDDTNDDGFRHNLATSWSAAVVPNLFYVDLAGGVTETYLRSNSRFSGNAVANSDDRERAYYGLISPSLRRNIGGWANAEVRYTFRIEDFEDSDDGGYSQIISAGLTGDPRRFRRFGWQAVTEYEDYTPEDRDNRDLTRWTSYASVDVPVARTLAVTGTVGYDQFGDDVSPTEDVDGLWGNAGLRWQPNTRLAARTFAGYRYGGLDYGAEATYRLRDNLVAGLSARRGIQFGDFGDDGIALIGAGTDAQGRPQFVSPNGSLTADLDEALATDLLTGQQGRFADLDVSSQSETALVDTVSAFVSGNVGRTSYGLTGLVLHRDFDGGSPFEDETVYAVNLGLSRALTSRLALDAGLGYSATTGGENRFFEDGDLVDTEDGDFQTVAVGAGLSYQLTEIINVFGRYTYTKRFADNELDEYDENAGVIGVRASF